MGICVGRDSDELRVGRRQLRGVRFFRKRNSLLCESLYASSECEGSGMVPESKNKIVFEV